ncbi:MAG: 30S ribosomal protein S2, partial [Patescibacteria group bacterium]|nr:30S ribosomal protein S2 [Patescibacteria group bacterium]
ESFDKLRTFSLESGRKKKGDSMKTVSLRDLLEAGCHFGHQTTRWNPKMKPYIFTARDRIHIFDLVKTKQGLEAAASFAEITAANGGKIIFVGTKRQAQDLVKEAAQKIKMPYMTERWVGGLITNWEQMKKRLSHLADLKSGKAEGRFKSRTKKENLLIDREITKMEKIFGGVADLTEIPAAVFVTDAKKDEAALKEARNRGVKTIAIVDTNVNPDYVDFVIPANDDATKCLQLIIGFMAEAIEEGKKNKGTGNKEQGIVKEESKEQSTVNREQSEEKPKKKVAKKTTKIEAKEGSTK